ncbi:periplasmic heavy metal sensor [Pararobbsia silviterrae]|uniref:Periplasmic heavy metal sensor n=1 Tax=Pararobbsia silviterrae TaxID=1792498 RepID=A0A494YFQ6_9BURK|nr:periplasmic heavy metal sensor [Pararobbsia silviterrae]RKP59183.1 periplasmic heavy metal sensor [Pararobbsia silviterrae]
MFRKTTFTAAIAGIATTLALTAGGVAFAQSAAPGAPSGPHGGGWHHHHGHRHHGGLEHELMKVQPQLNLNAQQQALWQTAVNTTKANREQARALRKSDMAQFRSQLQAPILDLSALHAERQQQFQKFQQLHEQTEQAWLNVYNGLNDQQKTLVSAVIKADLAELRLRHGGPKQDWQHRQPASGAAAQ